MRGETTCMSVAQQRQGRGSPAQVHLLCQTVPRLAVLGRELELQPQVVVTLPPSAKTSVQAHANFLPDFQHAGFYFNMLFFTSTCRFFS